MVEISQTRSPTVWLVKALVVLNLFNVCIVAAEDLQGKPVAMPINAETDGTEIVFAYELVRHGARAPLSDTIVYNPTPQELKEAREKRIKKKIARQRRRRERR